MDPYDRTYLQRDNLKYHHHAIPEYALPSTISENGEYK